eukprot:3940436-Rhodomonas_salina.1
MSGVRVNLGTGVVNTAIVVEKLLAMPRTTLAATVILCAAYSFSLLPPSKIKHKMTATELTVENRKFHWLWKGWEGDQVLHNPVQTVLTFGGIVVFYYSCCRSGTE